VRFPSVLIAGGGPAGACLASLLARQGVAVTLVEASRRFDRQFRGQGLMPSGVEALAAMGLWPLPAAIPQRPLRGWSFVLDRRELFTVTEPMGSPWPCTLIEPGALLRHLLTQLADHAQVRLLMGRSIVGLEEREGAICGVELSDGQRLETGLVVACDGRNSVLRQLAGLPLATAASAIDVLWFRLPESAGGEIGTWLDDRFVTLLGRGGSCALFRRADGGVQLGWVIDAASSEAPSPAQSQHAAARWPQRWADLAPAPLAELLGQLAPGAIRGPVRLPVRVGLAPCWQRPGLLLLGDAAHPMSPVRAQGLNMALRDAVVAAGHLAPLLADGARSTPPRPAALAAALRRIETERLPELQAVQALQYREGQRGELLRQNHSLRALLAATAPLSGPLLARRWRSEQRILRQGITRLKRP
jgi:2-polyprenyl-6-methoxyphenol hydroxylase-like FAD-dependent oxidoreductase